MLKLNLAVPEQNIWFMKFSHLNNLLLDTFARLPADKYLNGQSIFRYRRYHTGLIDNNHYAWDDKPNYFMQSRKNNSFAGEIKRFYEPLEEIVKEYVKNFLVPFAMTILPAKKFATGVHQIRVCTHDNLIGKPSPEGIHQDGFDYVMVACININNIAGGNSLIVDEKDKNKIIYDEIMKPYDIIIFDDKVYAHYVSPITPKLPGNGYRDVIVITLKEQVS